MTSSSNGIVQLTIRYALHPPCLSECWAQRQRDTPDTPRGPKTTGHGEQKNSQGDPPQREGPGKRPPTGQHRGPPGNPRKKTEQRGPPPGEPPHTTNTPPRNQQKPNVRTDGWPHMNACFLGHCLNAQMTHPRLRKRRKYFFMLMRGAPAQGIIFLCCHVQ